MSSSAREGFWHHAEPSGRALQRSPQHRQVTQIFQQLREPVFRYVYRILQDAAEAEDTTQEAFLRLYKELRSGRDIQFRPWLFRVAHNLAIDRVRQRGTVTTLAERSWSDLSDTTEDARHDVHQQTVESERKQRLRTIANLLTPRERRSIGLRLEGLRYREIAEVLGVRISSVENYVTRAVKKITKELDA